MRSTLSIKRFAVAYRYSIHFRIKLFYSNMPGIVCYTVDGAEVMVKARLQQCERNVVTLNYVGFCETTKQSTSILLMKG